MPELNGTLTNGKADRTDPKQADLEKQRQKLVSMYIDIINAHGTNSKEARAFEQSHGEDKELLRLLETAKEVKVMFLEGELE